MVSFPLNKHKTETDDKKDGMDLSLVQSVLRRGFIVSYERI